ncbi:unnamed protein product [Rhizophagus irregularis]|nr:unnamed protein product [Rhizophagus irregularis]
MVKEAERQVPDSYIESPEHRLFWMGISKIHGFLGGISKVLALPLLTGFRRSSSFWIPPEKNFKGLRMAPEYE